MAGVEDNPRIIERHLQSLLLALLTMVCGWLGLTVQDSTVKIAALTERVSNTQQNYDVQMIDLKARVALLESFHRPESR